MTGIYGTKDMPNDIERKLHERLLVGQRAAFDRLVLDDATLAAALDGSRPLTAGERAALQGSPLTTRRLRHLALQARAAARRAQGWRGSRGMLRAAGSAALDDAPEPLRTDDGCWTLHFVRADAGWRAILQLAPAAPFAAELLATRARVAVRDGAGARLLQGQLDVDGECEAAWPHAQAPAAWLQAHGAAFSVELA